MKLKYIPMTLELGESPIWHTYRKTWIWLDIINKRLYELKHDEFELKNTECHYLESLTSALAVTDKSNILLVSSDSIDVYNLEERNISSLCSLTLPVGMRTNEGGMGADGRFWFSSMELSPRESKGIIYSLDSQLKIEAHIEGIGIPNTMVWGEDNKFYLTDSYIGKTYTYPISQGGELMFDRELFYQTKSDSGTPDGGAMDENGNLWVAIWGGHKVICINRGGEIIQTISLPVPQPSSCCFGGPEGKHLFITSARESMSQDDLERFPLSGSVFMLELNVPGQIVKDFEVENKDVS